MQAFQDFLAMQSIQTPVWGFVVDILLAAVLAYLLSLVYIRYGTSLSNRRLFSRNLVLLAMTTTLVIAVVKSSLALSLGLVGALSIVRFRAAIKEPEELMYLFFTIAIGLGLGAGQRLITVVAFLLIAGAIWIRSSKGQIDENHNLFISVSTTKGSNVKLENIVEVLKRHCSLVNLRRLDEHDGTLEASFLVDYFNFSQLQSSKEELNALDSNLYITFLDNKGIS